MFAMALSFAPLVQRDAQKQGSLITINGTSIMPEQFQLRLHQISERLQMIGKQLGLPMEMFLKGANPEAIAYQSLIEDTLLDQTAKAAKITISPNFIDVRLSDPQFVMNELSDVMPWYVMDESGAINPEALENYLKKTGRSVEEFEESLVASLRRGFVKDIITSSAYILPGEYKDYFIANHLAKSFDIITFSLEDFKAQEARKEIAQKDLRTFFDAENRKSKRYWVPAKRAGQAFVFSPEQYALKVSDKEIKQYYDLNKTKKYQDSPQQIQLRKIVLAVDPNAKTEDTQALEKKANELLAQVKEKPALFAELARQHSTDKETAAKGGLMDFANRGDLDPAVDQAAFRLKNDNDVAELLVTNRGYEIIQRVAKKAASYQPLEKVRDAIKEQLIRQKFNVAFGQDMNKLVHKAESDPSVIAKFAQEKKAVKKSVPLSTKEESHFSQKLFKLRKGNWTYYFNDKKGIALQLTELEKSYAPKLESVSDQVKEDLILSRAQKALNAAVKKAEESAVKADLAALAKDLGGSFETTPLFKKKDSQKYDHYSKKGAPLKGLMASSLIGATASATTPEYGFVVQLAKIEPFDQELFEKSQEEVKTTLQRERQTAVMQGFVASLYRNATIESMDPNLNTKG
jgi:parvulin-like peptidyl-prolyl isomerase